ncbi:MAG: asparagine synthase (glutamine-hydrolyzing) [Chlamydiia bacterium]|nr:asparagine synthase (glutamine-hydrolyzing) [Chlamydiia bacterium]
MQTQNGLHVLSYNGEVYNFRELRTKLEGLGHSFVSGTDSEVVLKSFAHWGRDAILRFNGMCAGAWWNREEQELTLFRDRYGIKPLYYALIGSTLLFGSEIKALLAYPEFPREVDREGMAEYFAFQNFFSDRTLIRHVKMLPAGCTLSISLGQRQLSPPQRYWDYNFTEDTSQRSEADYLEEFDHLFRRAVKRQLVSDVAVGSYLSGGMDSGSITAIAASQFPYMKTFTIGFDMQAVSELEAGFDERLPAEHMSSLFQTEHYEMVLKAGDMERVIPSLTYHLEEPRVGQSYPNYYAAQLASKFVKVVLAGTGGDELFGGYPWRYYRAVNNSDFDDYVNKYHAYWQRLVPDEHYHALLSPLGIEVPDSLSLFRSVFPSRAHKLCRPEDYVNHSLYFEAKTFLHGLLVVEDKLSMAHSLESRVPFLDNDLVDFAMRLPVRLKLAKLDEMVRIDENERGKKTDTYYRQHHDGKRLLRKAMRRYIPLSITDAKKQGFSAPDATWFRGRSVDFVRRDLLAPSAPLYDYLDRSVCERLIENHLSGRANRRLLLWSLLYCNCFLSRFLSSDSPQGLPRPSPSELACSFF